MLAQSGLNGQAGDRRTYLLERLAAIKIHVGSIRRAARRPESLDKTAVVAELDHIDRQVTQAVQCLDSNPSKMN